MNGMSKADTLNLLDSHGLNTVDRIVVKKPFRAETLIGRLVNFPYEVISLRSWKEKMHLCPFYPNRPTGEILQIINDEWSKLKGMDEIIISQGINPEDSVMAGKIMDWDNEYVVEYFKGPGTVRKLDTITPLTERFPKRGMILSQVNKGWAPLYIAAKAFFRAYPGTIIEWSYYPYKIGKKNENWIYWEVL